MVRIKPEGFGEARRRMKEDKMEKDRKSARDCRINGQSYADGQEICYTDGCKRCNDGQWEDRFEDLVFGVGP